MMSNPFRRALCLCLALPLAGLRPAAADDRTWDGGGGDSNWNTPANWDGNLTSPSADDALFFGGTLRVSNTNNLAADTSFAGITFNSGAGAFTLAGNRITLGGDVVNHDDSLQTINLPMILSATRTFNTASTGSLTVGGILSGSGGLVKSGNQTLTLSAANEFTGGVVINGGVLDANSAIGNGGVAGSLGAASAAAANLVINGGTLQYRTAIGSTDRGITIGTNGGTIIGHATGNGTTDFSGPLALDGTGARTIVLSARASNRTYTWSANMGDNGGSTSLSVINPDNGGSSWSLTGNLTFTGGLSVGSSSSGGRLTLSGSSLGYTGDITIYPNATLTLSGTSSFSQDIVNNGTLAAAGSTTMTYSGTIDGSGGFSMGQASLRLTGTNNSYTGGTSNSGNVAGYFIEVAKLANGGQNSSIGASSSAAANLQLGLNTGGSNYLRYVGTGDTTDRLFTLRSNGGGTFYVENNGSGALSFTNTGTIAFGNADKNLTFGLSGTYAGETNTFAPAIADNGTGVISFRKDGASIWTISGTKTYSGTTSVNGGILNFANTAAKSAGTAVTVAAPGSVGLGVGGAGYFSSADVDALFANTLSGVSMAAASGVAIDTSAGNFTYATSQSAARALTKLGANTLTLTGTNTYTGTTTIRAGTLEVAAGGAINGTSGITIVNGADLLYNSLTPLTRPVTVTNGTIGGTGTISTAVTIGANATVSPGNSPGSQAYTAMTWAPGGTYLWEINDAAGTAGADPGWDLLNLGTLTLSGLSASTPFAIDIAGLSGLGSAPARGTAMDWNIVDYGTLVGGFDSSWFALNAGGFADPAWNTVVWTLLDTGEQLRLQAFQIPEPTSALLLALAGLLARRRRR